MTTTLRDVVLAMRTGHAALVGENAGYLVLLAADAAVLSPAVATREAVHLDEDGTVRLVGMTASAVVAEMSLRRLLGDLLAELRSPAPNLERVAQRSDSRGLDTLVLELEAALVPVNRRAAKRSLARLFRETERARKKYAADFAVVPRSPAPAPVQAAPARPVASAAPAAASAAPAAPAASMLAAQPEAVVVSAPEIEVELDVPTNVLPSLAVAPLVIPALTTPQVHTTPQHVAPPSRSSSPAMLDALARSGITKSPEPPQMRSPRAPVVSRAPVTAAPTRLESAPAQAPWAAPEVPSLEPPRVEMATPFMAGVRDTAPLLDEPEVDIDVE